VSYTPQLPKALSMLMIILFVRDFAWFMMKNIVAIRYVGGAT
jgi:hypothetical protein